MTESDSESTATPADDGAQSSADRVIQAMATLKGAGDSGANWFYWIGGLSLVNTAMLHSGGNLHFIVGLGITMLVDVIAAVIGKEHPEVATVVMVFAIGFSIFVSAMSFLVGWLSRKRLLWIFGIGMFLYLLDGLLYLLVQDWASVAFHAYALYSMIQGFRAYQQLSQLEAALQAAATAEVPSTGGRLDTGFETA